jgi:drug/metabolite transporter (DMT)-like permease
MAGRSQAEIGAACVAIFVVGSAFRDVYLGDIFQSVSIFLVLVIAFGIATIAGLGVACVRGKSLKFVLRRPSNVIMMNLGTAGAWICYFSALKWLDPSIVNTLFAGIGPFAVIALDVCRMSIAAPHPTTVLQKALQLGVIGSLCALIWIVVTGRSGFQSAHPILSFGSAGLALLAGSLITVGHLYAKRLDECGASPEAILGTRFFALLIVACVAIVHEGAATVIVPLAEMAYITGAATLLIVAPVFFNQVGMAKISPLAARVMTAGGPVLVFALQQFDPRIAWSTATFAAIVAYSGFVIAANLVHGRIWKAKRAIPAKSPAMPS